ncbi:MAG: phosphoribosylanthranilate isomerase [Verrucomicrobia bacterium]|nr:phosphoribosylanthranilate isomerase [Verrucomicrobiota bacterium]
MKPFFAAGATDPVKVKICGVTNLHDAQLAFESGADAIGINVFSGSKRFVDWADAGAWLPTVPASLTRIVVAVNPEPAEAFAWLRDERVDALQLHGESWLSLLPRLREFGKPIIRAIRVRRIEDLQSLTVSTEFGLLVDSYQESLYGGTGTVFPWNWLENWDAPKPLIVAGGLTPENVNLAIKATRPYAVDVASGVEQSPRKKDPEKLRAFVAAAKSALSIRH